MKQFKKGLGLLLALALAVSLCMGVGTTAFAADSAAELAYDLTADGKTSVSAETGDVITVTFSIRRTDSEDSYDLVGFQNEIIYDQTFFEYVDGSAVSLRTGIAAPLFQTRISGQHIVKSSDLNHTHAAQEDICSFQLRVKGTFGSGTISCTEAMAFDGDLQQVELETHTLTVALTTSGGTVDNGGATITVPSGGGGGTGTSIKVPVLVVDDMAVIEDSDIPLAGEITGVENLPVEMNLTGMETQTDTLALSLETVRVIAQKAEESEGTAEVLRIVWKTGVMTLNKDALNDLLDKATGDDLRFHLERVELDSLNSEQQSALQQDEVHAVFDAYITSNEIRITDLQNGTIAVSVPFAISDEFYSENFSVWYVAQDGSLEELESVFQDGTAVWMVSRLANYVIRYIGDRVPEYLRCAQDESCPISNFTDTNAAAWYHDGIHYALDSGLMEGYSESTFAPEVNTTRAQLVTILYRLEDSPETESSAFLDVEDGLWYSDPIGWAAANEIVSGYSKDAFGPNDPLSREQMAAILYHYAEYKGFDVTASESLDSFQDASHVGGFAEAAMAWAVAEGLLEGVSENTLSPEGPAIRAQAATILLRFHSSVEQ